MKIREKALAGIICIILLFLALLAIISSSIIMKIYEDIESAQLTDYSRLAISNIQAELSFLSTIARSWSEWDESYAFAEGKNPGFIEENFNSGSFLRYDINAIIITDERGRVLFSQGYDYDTGQLEPVPASAMSAIATSGSSLMDLSSDGYAGFIPVPEKNGPGFFAASPILHSDHAGPPKGMLIMGKYIYADEVEKFRPGPIRSLSITTISPPGDTVGPGGDGAPETSPVVKIVRVNETFIEGLAGLSDYNNIRTVRVTVGIPRTMTTEGKKPSWDSSSSSLPWDWCSASSSSYSWIRSCSPGSRTSVPISIRSGRQAASPVG